MNEKLEALYNDYSSEFKAPDFETFKTALRDPNKRKLIYNDMSQVYNIPDFEKFDSDVVSWNTTSEDYTNEIEFPGRENSFIEPGKEDLFAIEQIISGGSDTDPELDLQKSSDELLAETELILNTKQSLPVDNNNKQVDPGEQFKTALVDEAINEFKNGPKFNPNNVDPRELVINPGDQSKHLANQLKPTETKKNSIPDFDKGKLRKSNPDIAVEIAKNQLSSEGAEITVESVQERINRNETFISSFVYNGLNKVFGGKLTDNDLKEFSEEIRHVQDNEFFYDMVGRAIETGTSQGYDHSKSSTSGFNLPFFKTGIRKLEEKTGYQLSDEGRDKIAEVLSFEYENHINGLSRFAGDFIGFAPSVAGSIKLTHSMFKKFMPNLLSKEFLPTVTRNAVEALPADFIDAHTRAVEDARKRGLKYDELMPSYMLLNIGMGAAVGTTIDKARQFFKEHPGALARIKERMKWTDKSNIDELNDDIRDIVKEETENVDQPAEAAFNPNKKTTSNTSEKTTINKSDKSKSTNEDQKSGQKSNSDDKSIKSEENKPKKQPNSQPDYSNKRVLQKTFEDEFGLDKEKADAVSRTYLQYASSMAKVFNTTPEEFIKKNLAKIKKSQLSELSKEGQAKFQLIGEMGTQNLHARFNANLNKARELESFKKSPEQIYNMTGWERGIDGFWRAELIPSKAKFDSKLDSDKEFNSTLGDLVKWPQLFKAYPELKKVKIEQVDLPGSRGDFAELDNTIRIEKSGSAAEKKSTLFHEIQHWIQSKEGFAEGTSPSGAEAYKRVIQFDQDNLINSINTYRKNLSEESQKLIKKASSKEYEDVVKKYPEAKSPEEAFTLKILDEDELYDSMVKQIKRNERLSRTDANKLYRRTAGEVEARNVQVRAKLSDKELKKTPFSKTEDVSRDEQLIISLGNGAANRFDQKFKNKAKFQSSKGTAKGAITFDKDGRAIIHALNKPDVSTAIHELWHMAEKFLTVDEIKYLQKWAKSQGWDGKDLREFSEFGARGFEKYASEGIAPTPQLKRIFEKFKQWLNEIYQDIKNSPLELELDDRMREIYKRFLNTDPPLKKAKLIDVMQHEVKDKLFRENLDYSTIFETSKNLSFKAKTERRVNKTQILDAIRDHFGVILRSFGTNRRKAVGYYELKSEIVRIKRWGDLDVVAHELAHWIDYSGFLKGRFADSEFKKFNAEPSSLLFNAPKKHSDAIAKELANLDYDPKAKRLYEGFAEYMRHYLVNTGLAESKAPVFHKFLHEQFLPKYPDVQKSIEHIKDLYQVWSLQGAPARIRSQIDKKGEHTKTKLKDKPGELWTRFNVNFVDSQYRLKQAVKDAIEESQISLKPTEDPAKIAKMHASKSTSVAHKMVYEVATDLYGNVTGKSLKEILEPVGKDIDNFIDFAVVTRAADLEHRGIESGFNIADVFIVREDLRSPLFEKTLKEMNGWTDNLLHYLKDAGGLSDEQFKIIKELNPNYVPFMRAFKQNEKLLNQGKSGKAYNSGNSIFSIKGSGRAIKNPIESIIAQASTLISKAHKIHVASTIADLAEIPSMNKWVTEMPNSIQLHKVSMDQVLDQLRTKGFDTDKIIDQGDDIDKFLTFVNTIPQYKGSENIVSIWKNGEQKLYEFHPDFMQAIIELEPLDRGAFVRFAGGVTRLFRTSTTGVNAPFFFRNLIRDAISQALGSNRPGATPFDPVKGLISIAKGSDAYQKFKSLGGDLSGMHGYDRKTHMRLYDELVLSLDGWKGEVKKVVKHPVDSFREVLSIGEMAPRVAEMEAQFKKLRKEHPDWSDNDITIEAFNEAQDVTINFTQSGVMGKRINEVVPFFNAAVQGVNKFYRISKHRPIQTITKGVAYITIPTLYIWSQNQKETWYQNIPPEYKYNNIFVRNGDVIHRYPIPHEYGAIFAALPQALLDQFKNKDPKAFSGFLKVFEKSLPVNTDARRLFGMSPTIIAGFTEVLANKNFLDAPIESRALQQLPMNKRIKDNTAEVAIYMSELFGTFSPVQWDHIIQSIVGGAFKQFSYKDDDNNPLPILGAFLHRNKERPARQVQAYFDELTDLSEKDTAKDLDLNGRRRLKQLKKIRKYVTRKLKSAYEADTADKKDVYFKSLRLYLERFGIDGSK